MKKAKCVIVLAAVAAACACLPALAQVAADPAAPVAVSPDSSGLAGFCVGLAAKYPWLATVLLIIGGLRVVFKPLMSLIDGYVKVNCSPEEYAKLQKFEAGPVFKWLSFGLDFVGSVKLPVIAGVKPAQK